MKQIWAVGLVLLMAVGGVVALASQQRPVGEKQSRQDERAVRPDGPAPQHPRPVRGAGDPPAPPPHEHRGGPPPFGPPPRWDAGKLLPPHLRDALELTEEQDQQLDRLEHETKDRLLKIFTADQKKKLADMRRGGPGGPPPGPPPGPPHDEAQPDGLDQPNPEQPRQRPHAVNPW